MLRGRRRRLILLVVEMAERARYRRDRRKSLTRTDRLGRLYRMAKPIELSSEQLRRSVSETIKRVAYTQQTYVITLYGKPVAQIVPLSDEKDEPKAKAKRRAAP